MKVLNVSLSVLVASGIAFAGGGFAESVEPVEPAVAVPSVKAVDESEVYVGFGYGALNQTSENIANQNNVDAEWDEDMFLFQAGYRYNKYIAAEARYWLGISDATQNISGEPERDVEGDYSAWGVFVKPIYPIGDLELYGLAGYADISLAFDDGSIGYWDTSGFAWGIGAQYRLMDNLTVFVDYVDMANHDEFDAHNNGTTTPDVSADIAINTVNVGISYSF